MEVSPRIFYGNHRHVTVSTTSLYRLSTIYLRVFPIVTRYLRRERWAAGVECGVMNRFSVGRSRTTRRRAPQSRAAGGTSAVSTPRHGAHPAVLTVDHMQGKKEEKKGDGGRGKRDRDRETGTERRAPRAAAPKRGQRGCRQGCGEGKQRGREGKRPPTDLQIESA